MARLEKIWEDSDVFGVAYSATPSLTLEVFGTVAVDCVTEIWQIVVLGRIVLYGVDGERTVPQDL